MPKTAFSIAQQSEKKSGIKFIQQICCSGWAHNIAQWSRRVRNHECWQWRVVATIFEEEWRGSTHWMRRRRENMWKKEVREVKEKEKQTEQDREISKTQWALEAWKQKWKWKRGVLEGQPAPVQPQWVSTAVPHLDHVWFPSTSPKEQSLSWLMLRDTPAPKCTCSP